jgi:hypothetical protein
MNKRIDGQSVKTSCGWIASEIEPGPEGIQPGRDSDKESRKHKALCVVRIERAVTKGMVVSVSNPSDSEEAVSFYTKTL